MLTGHEIRNQYYAGNLVIEPFDEACIGPNSYDVHLGDRLSVYTDGILDPKEENGTVDLFIPEDGLVLQPGVLYLGRTVEYTESPNHIPMYEGRSSLGRLGVMSHSTAGFGDIGFQGTWTLELTVVRPVWVYPGMRIGQFYWHRPDGLVLHRYDGKYQGQEAATASRMYKDREWRDNDEQKRNFSSR